MPWEPVYMETYDWVHSNLHIVHKVHSTLTELWFNEFINTRFISLQDLNSAALPMYPDDFEKFVQKKCLEQRELLEKTWIPKCAKIIIELKECWKNLVPTEEDASLEMPMRFFGSIAILMSNQLRDLVVDSLDELVQFFEQYKEGNNFENYEDFDYKRKAALIIKLYIDDPKIEFQPVFKKIETLIMNCFNFIIKSSEELPRVEVELFPFPDYKKYVLRTIRPDEELFHLFTQRALAVYEANKIGPQRYLDTYKKYNDFMNKKAEQDVANFLKSADNQLEDYEFQINKHSDIKHEITQLLLTVPLNLYSLECNNLHETLKERVQKLKDRIVQFCIDFNRDTNKA